MYVNVAKYTSPVDPPIWPNIWEKIRWKMLTSSTNSTNPLICYCFCRTVTLPAWDEVLSAKKIISALWFKMTIPCAPVWGWLRMKPGGFEWFFFDWCVVISKFFHVFKSWDLQSFTNRFWHFDGWGNDLRNWRAYEFQMCWVDNHHLVMGFGSSSGKTSFQKSRYIYIYSSCVCLRWLFTFYHGRSPLNHNLGEYVLLFSKHFKQI